MSNLFTDEQDVFCQVEIALSMDSDKDDDGGDVVIKYKTWLEELFNIIGFQFEPVIVLEIDNYKLAEEFVWFYDFVIRKTTPGFERYADLFSCAYNCLDDFLEKVSGGNVGFLLFDFLKKHAASHNFNFDFENYRKQIRDLQSKIDNVANKPGSGPSLKTKLLLPSSTGLESSGGTETSIEHQSEATPGLDLVERGTSPSPSVVQDEDSNLSRGPLSPLPPNSEPSESPERSKKSPLPPAPPMSGTDAKTGGESSLSPTRPGGVGLPSESEEELFLPMEAEINLLPLDYGPIEFYIAGEREMETYPMDREDIEKIYKNLKHLKRVFIELEKREGDEVWAKLVEIIEEE